MAYAKANPGKLNYGSAGLATITHLFGEMLCLEAGIRMTHVPYRGSAPATNALLAGEIQAQFDQTTLPHIKAGKLRALAMLAEVRHPGFPRRPNPAGDRLRQGGRRFLVRHPRPGRYLARGDRAPRQGDCRGPARARHRAKVHNGGMRVTYLDPADFRRQIGTESAMFGTIIKKGDIKLP